MTIGARGGISITLIYRLARDFRLPKERLTFRGAAGSVSCTEITASEKRTEAPSLTFAKSPRASSALISLGDTDRFEMRLLVLRPIV